MVSWSTFTSAVVAGILLGISFVTGFSFSPNNYLISAISNIFQFVNLPETNSFWYMITLVIGVLGVIASIMSIISVLSEGITGILITFLGTTGAFLIVGYNQLSGIILIILGGLLVMVGPPSKKIGNVKK